MFFRQHVSDLSLHIHDDNGVGTVTDDELFDVTRQRMNAVHSDVCAGESAQRLERVQTLRTLYIPHFYCTIRTCANTIKLSQLCYHTGYDSDGLGACNVAK